MFLGHQAVAFAAKRVAPRTSLGTLLAAATFIDLLWPILLIAGWEHVRIEPGNTRMTPLDFYDYPISHSLLTCAGWGLLFGAVYWLATRRLRGAVVAALAVVSHWVLDWFTHRPDLPLYPGGPKEGLGLWNHVGATLVVESLLFLAGLFVYVRMTKPRDRTGTISLAAFVLLMLVIYAGNVAGPPPPDPKAIAWVGLAQFLIPLWGAWIDRHRELRTAD